MCFSHAKGHMSTLYMGCMKFFTNRFVGNLCFFDYCIEIINRKNYILPPKFHPNCNFSSKAEKEKERDNGPQPSFLIAIWMKLWMVSVIFSINYLNAIIKTNEIGE
jgi:hypothetical protein